MLEFSIVQRDYVSLQPVFSLLSDRRSDKYKNLLLRAYGRFRSQHIIRHIVMVVENNLSNIYGTDQAAQWVRKLDSKAARNRRRLLKWQERFTRSGHRRQRCRFDTRLHWTHT